MGPLFDRALRKGFSDVFDSAYGGSALENRLKGALASSLYDARLSSSGYNQARTRTVEDELANRQSLRKRLVEGGDPNALDRFDIGPGHSQDYMKGQVGQTKEDRLVKELESLAGGSERDKRTRSGTILGSSVAQIGSGQKSEVGAQIARETQDKVTAALGVMKSADRNTPQGQKLYQDALTEALMLTEKTGNLSSISQIESKIGANVALKSKREAQGLAALGSMESQRQYRQRKLDLQKLNDEGKLDIEKIKATAYSDWKKSQSLVENEKIQVEKAKVHEIEVSKLLKENKIDKVKAEIKNANKKTKAEIKRIDQLVKSGTIKDLEVRENTRLIGERMKTEVKKREVMGETVKKIQTEAKKMEAVIAKVTAQTKGEHVDIGLKIAEFLGVGKPPSGDSLLNNYTKMYVQIMEEDPILLSGGQPIVINRTDDNPEGQKKLFSHLNSDEQKSYVQTRMINARAKAYAQSSEPIHPIVQSMIEAWTKVEKSLVEELAMSPAGDQAVSPDEGPPAQTDGQPPAIAQPPAAVDTGSDLTSVLGQLSGTGEMQFDDSQVANALKASNAVVQDDLTAVQSVPTDVPGGNITARQDAGKDEALQKMVSENGWSSNIATIFSGAIATQVISPAGAEKLAKMSVVQLQELITAQQNDKNFATDILPIVKTMIAEKQAGG